MIWGRPLGPDGLTDGGRPDLANDKWRLGMSGEGRPLTHKACGAHCCQRAHSRSRGSALRVRFFSVIHSVGGRGLSRQRVSMPAPRCLLTLAASGFIALQDNFQLRL